ncbi:M56 family metallopeptidase [Streptosporangium sp. G12]
MTYVAHHLIVLLTCLAAALVMARGTWSWRAPRTALFIWQAIGLSTLLSVVGTAVAVGLAPYRLGVLPALGRFAADLAGGRPRHDLSAAQVTLTVAGVAMAAWVLVAFAVSALSVASLRRRHRALLRLVARTDPGARQALVLEHPDIAAYCLPGRRATIVVSTGTLGLLGPRELEAVLAHERAHARERHDLVLLPFAALRRAFPWSRGIQVMLEAVALLVEMRADDRAAHERDRLVLVEALRRFRDCDRILSPAGTLGGAGQDMDARISRLRTPARMPLALRVLALAAALTVASTPLSLFLLPM